MTYQLVYSSLTPSTRFPTGTVLVLLTPVRLDRMLPCEDLPLQNHPYMSLYFSSSGSDYPVTLERLEHWAGFEPATLRICNPLH